jgi:amino acid transporter
MYILTITIILSTFSSALSNFYTGSRLNYAAARFGYQIKLLAMVHPDKKTPDPSLIFAVNTFLK